MTTNSTTLTWDALSYEATIEADSQALLLTQFQGPPLIASYIATFAFLAQLLEDAMWDMLTLRGVDVATGDQLDQLGKLVGEQRLGGTDDDYRARIRTRIRVNISNGRVEDVIAAVVLYEGIAGTGGVQVREYTPMAMVVELKQPSTRTPALTLGIVNQARPAAVGTQLVYPTTSASTSLIAGYSGDGTVVSATQGAGWSGDLTFGGLAGGVAT